jgi:hypothetical protein
MLVLAHSPVWTFWMGVGVFLLVIAVAIGVTVGYFVKVVRPKYPPRSADRA